MEKNIKLRNKILKILPKTMTLTFQNHPFSPGRDHHKSRQTRPHGGKGFSGPLVSKKLKEINRIDFEEPTSPKISCMGQIKHKKKQNKKAKDIEVKKRVTTFQKMLFHVGKPKSEGRKKSDVSEVHDKKYALEERATHVNQMKRFASGRGTFANFDWKDHVETKPDEIDDYYSDEERIHSDDDEDEDGEEFMIPFSAPILVGGGYGHGLDLKPRKEINLWKRRTMAPPRPLQLDAVN
ncbi:unnamed protein product [Trifolium pratense]|uniref:Uncharacterized protein n=1 Tax=Trifolium pratense TaxID=57577 RepID=A0ACB0JGV2_TRIPR|nr:unnamed protein product [Trifolium pratense]